MLLPQGKAYNALAKRLKSIEMLIQIDNDLTDNITNNDTSYNEEEINYFVNIFLNSQSMLYKFQINK